MPIKNQVESAIIFGIDGLTALKKLGELESADDSTIANMAKEVLASTLLALGDLHGPRALKMPIQSKEKVVRDPKASEDRSTQAQTTLAEPQPPQQTIAKVSVIPLAADRPTGKSLVDEFLTDREPGNVETIKEILTLATNATEMSINEIVTIVKQNDTSIKAQEVMSVVGSRRDLFQRLGNQNFKLMWKS